MGREREAPVLAKRVGEVRTEAPRAVVQYRGSGADAIQRRNVLRARDAGILSNGPPRVPLAWEGQPSQAEVERVERVDADVQRRLDAARMQSKDKRTATGLGALEGVRVGMPNLVLFKPLAHAGDLQTSVYNERALCRIATSIREQRQILANSISGYVSAIKTLVERHHGQPLLCPTASGKMLSELYLNMRKEDGPSHAAGARPGLGGHHGGGRGRPGADPHWLGPAGSLSRAGLGRGSWAAPRPADGRASRASGASRTEPIGTGALAVGGPGYGRSHATGGRSGGISYSLLAFGLPLRTTEGYLPCITWLDHTGPP